MELVWQLNRQKTNRISLFHSIHENSPVLGDSSWSDLADVVLKFIQMLSTPPILTRFLKQHTGPLTRDLVQEPGDFGLGKIPSRLKPSSTVTSICGYCATGCQLKLHLDEHGNAINLSPQAGYPVNLGMACPKGWQALDPLDSPDRATTPLLRDASGKLQPVDWATAMDAFTTRLKTIQSEHGRESVGFLSTGQIPFEEMAFLGCLYKFGMGFLHCDANTRQCMATSVVAYKQSFGFDAPPATYADFEESDVIILIGANLCIAHPILWQRVMRNQRNPKIIVIDPRATETAQAATQHIALKPKGDLALLYAIAHCILRDGRIDKKSIENTEGIEEFTEFVKDYSPASVAENGAIRGNDRNTGPRRFRTWKTRFLVVDDGRQPILRRCENGTGDDQSLPHHGKYRQARHRAELDHRSVQCDGFAIIF